MILLLGKEFCSACNMTKTILKNKGVEFEYKLLSELDDSDKNKYLNLAEEKGINNLPIILDNDEIKTLKEVLN